MEHIIVFEDEDLFSGAYRVLPNELVAGKAAALSRRERLSATPRPIADAIRKIQMLARGAVDSPKEFVVDRQVFQLARHCFAAVSGAGEVDDDDLHVTNNRPQYG